MGLNLNALSILGGSAGSGGTGTITASGTASINDVITAGNLTSDLNISTTAAPAGTQGISNIINATGSTGLQSFFPTGPVVEKTSSVLQITGLGLAVGATLSIQVNQASGSTAGYLSPTDWTTFNNKVSTTRVIGTTFPLLGGGDLSADRVLSMPIADGSTGGYLSATDWNTFNSKQSAISIGPFSNTSYLNGATLFGPTFQLGAADFNNPGGINITGQTFAGDKTFTGVLAAPNGTASAVGLHLGTDVGTGFFRSAIDQLSMSAAGATIATWGTAGLKLYNLTASQAVVSDASKVLSSLAYGSTNVNSTLMIRDSSGRSQVTDPVMPQDIATKNYADTLASSLNPLQGVYAATTANIVGTYLNGVGGIGAIFTVTATGAFTLDGTTPPQGSRILLKDQSTGFQNGIYDLTTAGSVGVSPVLTRSLDYNQPSSVNAGDLIPVINGTVNTKTSWLQTATVTTIGTDALVFVEWTANPASYLLKANNLSDVANANTSLNNILPNQSGNNGLVLTSNGTDSSWAAPGAGGALTPTTQKFLSGSGTYTTPTSPAPLYIRVTAIGGGGGSSGSGTASGGVEGGAGGNTTFGTALISAGGGAGGTWGSTSAAAGGAVSLGAAVGIALVGGSGGNYASNGTDVIQTMGAPGGQSVLGGGGGAGVNGVAGFNGATNTGGGAGAPGGPASANALSGNSGAAGGYVNAIIVSPVSSYSYAVGAGGSGGNSGTSGSGGGVGGSGVLIVEEYYANGSIGTASNVTGGAAGDLLYQSASSTTAKLTIGTTNYMLAVVGGVPTWINGTGLGTTPGVSQVTVTTPSGYGSTNNKIRIFSVVSTNIGSSITYATSATNGDSFTINNTGIYSITYADGASAQGNFYGVSVNSNQLTTSIDTITTANFVMDMANPVNADAYAVPLSITKQFAAGDVIRAHTGGSGLNGTDKRCQFNIVRIA